MLWTVPIVLGSLKQSLPTIQYLSAIRCKEKNVLLAGHKSQIIPNVFSLSKNTNYQFAKSRRSAQNSRKFDPDARGILVQFRAEVTWVSSPKCQDWIRDSPAPYWTGNEPLPSQVQRHGSETDHCFHLGSRLRKSLATFPSPICLQEVHREFS